MSIIDYLNEFDGLNNKMVKLEIVLPDCVLLVYQLLKNLILSSEKQQLARTTITELTFANMKRQIKAIHEINTSTDNSSRAIKVEPTSLPEIKYGSGYGCRDCYNFTSRGRGGKPTKKIKPVDSFGQITKCAHVSQFIIGQYSVQEKKIEVKKFRLTYF